MSLADCLKKSGKNFSPEEKVALFQAAGRNVAAKMERPAAEIAAVQGALDEAVTERQEVIDAVYQERPDLRPPAEMNQAARPPATSDIPGNATQAAETGETNKDVALLQPKADYNENQLELIYDNAETRPGTTQEQKTQGIHALRALFGRDRRAGGSILGSRLWKDFQERKGTELIGQEARTPGDLATLAQILRDPRFETLRFFFVKDGKIVEHTAVTSRLPGAVSVVGRVTSKSPDAVENQFDKYIAELKAMKKATKADGYYMLHNHPSGRAIPSDADVSTTQRVAEDMPGFLGHVIINHNEYAEIGRRGTYSTKPIESGESRAAEVTHDMLGKPINGPMQLVDVAKGIQAKKGFAVLIGQNGTEGRVTAIAEIPESALSGLTERERMRAIVRVRHFARFSGSQSAFVVSSNPSAYDFLIENGVARDVVSATGESRAAHGVQTRRTAGYNPGRLDAETGYSPYGTVNQTDKEVRVDPGDLSKAVLSRMDVRLKAMGYDSRGSDDVRSMLYTKIAPKGVITHPDWIEAYKAAVSGAERTRERVDAKRAARGNATNVDFARMRELGLTGDWREAGYIAPRGSLIDLSGKKEGGERGTRSYDHREAGGTLGMQEYMALGHIRIDGNSGSMDISREPTPEQYRRISEFAEDHGGEVVLDLEGGLGEIHGDYYLKPERTFSREYPSGTRPARIIADIRKFFAGEKPVDMPEYSQPWYYSELARQISAPPTSRVPAGGLTAAQWQKLIWEPETTKKVAIRDAKNKPTGETKDVVVQGRSNLPDVKQEEITWTSILEWLDLEQARLDAARKLDPSAPKTITKEQVQTYLDAGGVQVTTKVLGGKGTTTELDNRIRELSHWPEDPFMARDPANQEELSRLNDEWEKLDKSNDSQQPRFDSPDLQLPGSVPGSYRERVYTLPTRKAGYDNLDGIAKSMFGVEYDRLNDRDRAKVQSELFNPKEGEFESGHYPGMGNYIAHDRVSDYMVPIATIEKTMPELAARMRAEGRTEAKGLGVQEIQSDRAQKGRTEGFKQDVAPVGPADGFALTESEHQYHVRDPESGRNVDIGKGTVSDRNEAIAYAERYFTSSAKEKQQNQASRIAPAPFVTKTDSWTALVLKRILRQAAEEGYDFVFWTRGDQQVERYTSALRKAVDVIEWKKTPEGVQIVGYKGGQKGPDRRGIAGINAEVNTIIDRNDQLGFDTRGGAREALLQHIDWRDRWGEGITEAEGTLIDNWRRAAETHRPREKVVDTTEKESALSDAIGKSMADRIRNDPNQTGTIEGDGITVSDTGMAGYYDRIVPKVANEISKKLGGGKVVEVNMAREKVGKRVPDGAGGMVQATRPARFDLVPTGVGATWAIRNRDTGQFVADDQQGTWANRAEDGQLYSERAAIDAMQELINRENAGVGGIGMQQAVAITPVMREKIMGGQALFRRQAALPTGTAPALIKTQMAQAIAKLAIKTVIHDNVEAARAATGVDIPDTARAMYHAQQVHLFAGSLDTSLEVESAFWHEVLHAGLSHLYGTGSREYERALTKIASLNRNIRQNAAMWRGKYGPEAVDRAKDYGMTHAEAQRYMVLQSYDEALADLSGANAKIAGLKPFLAAVQKFLRAIGLTNLADAMENATDAEALSLIATARKAVTKQGTHIDVGALAPAFTDDTEGNRYDTGRSKNDGVVAGSQPGMGGDTGSLGRLDGRNGGGMQAGLARGMGGGEAGSNRGGNAGVGERGNQVGGRNGDVLGGVYRGQVLSRNGLLNQATQNELADPPKDEAEKVQSAIEGASPEDVARFIVQAGSKPQQVIAAKVFSQLQKLRAAGVRLEFKVAHVGDTIPSLLFGARGITRWQFKKDDNHITAWVNGADVTGKVGTSYETVLHELIHMATSGIVHLGSLKEASTYKSHADVAALRRVTNHVIKHFNQRVDGFKAGSLQLTEFEDRAYRQHINVFANVHETLAWGLSNPTMQEYMETIPYPAHKSAWTAFVSAIRKLLGLSENAETALTELLRVAENIMGDNANELLGLATASGENTAIQFEEGSGMLPQRTTPETGRSRALSDLRAAFDKHDDTGELTEQDLVDEVEGIIENQETPNADVLEEAVRTWRDEKAYDNELGGRNDMDSVNEEFVGALKSYLAKNEAKFSQPAERLFGAITTSPKTGAFLQGIMASPTSLGVFNAFNSQYHKAEMLARKGIHGFKAVFNEMQAFLNDINAIAVKAEQQAPAIFRELTGMSPKAAWDYFKGAAKESDIATIGPWLNHGTLYGKGNPLEGRVWTDDQLRGKFEGIGTKNPGLPALTEQQIELYHQARAAIDQSMEDNAKSIIFRHVNRLGVAFDKDMSLADVAETVRQKLDNLIEAERERAAAIQNLIDDPETEFGDEDSRDAIARLKRDIEKSEKAAAALEDTKTTVDGIEERANGLIEHGYMPLMRFGDRTVTARDAEGAVKFFYTTDGRPLVPGSANQEMYAVAQAVRAMNPDWQVTTGIKAERAWQMYSGLTLDGLENFLDFLDPETKAELERDHTIQEFLKNAVNNRSVLKRMIHRSGMPGFSKDVPRTLSSFITSNARNSSGMYHLAEARRLVEEIPDRHGDVKDEASDLVKYVTEPGEEAAKLRGFLFFNFLGGSLAAAAVNMTQTVMMTGPWLAQHAGAKDLGTALIGAAKLAVKDPINIEGAKGEALQKAERTGITAPQQIYHLTATAANNPFSSNRGFRSFMTIWGSLFSTVEVFNRRVAFLAAYDIGTTNGLTGQELYDFAVGAVVETQLIYNKGNKPNLGRGAVGSTVMTFKAFSIGYLELMRRLPPQQQLLMLGILALVAGGEGLPFAEDIEDLIDTLGQWLGFTTNTGKWTGKVIGATLGKDFERPILKGLGGMLPLDLHSRMGMQNLLPGTAFFKPSEIDKTRDVAEAVGPLGSVLQSFSQSLQLLARGKWDKAAVNAAPKAARDAYNGFHMMGTGESLDTKGRLAMKDVTVMEAAGKAVGFNPQRAAREGEAKRELMLDRNIRIVRMDEMASAMADATIRQDIAGRKEVMERLAEWNRDNPELAIAPAQLMRSVAERVRAQRLTSEQRFLKSVPKPLRQEARESLKQ